MLDAANLFVNPAHGIGTDFSQSGSNGPSIFPVTSLALRLQYRASASTSLRLAVLDGVPGDPDRPGHTAIKLGGGDRALLAGGARSDAHAAPAPGTLPRRARG